VRGKIPGSKGSCTRISEEGLHKWFQSRSTDGKRGWVQIGGKYDGKPCARQPGQTSTPKCASSSKRASMSKKQRRSAFRRKNQQDPNQPQKSGAAKPTYVSTDKPKMNEGKKDACYHKVKSRYKVWPSAYASGALVKCRKKGASNWGSKNESLFRSYATMAYALAEAKMKSKKASRKFQTQSKWNVAPAMRDLSPSRTGKVAASNKLPASSIQAYTTNEAKSPAWQRSEGKNPEGGLNAKGVASYRAQNPGSKLKTAVTTKPSKLKKGSKAAKRRKSFCARMKGMRKRQKSSNNTGNDRLSLSLRKWNC
jgi:hypothetical protein